MFFRTPAQDIWDICMFAAVAIAFWRGGWPERLAALGMVADSIASALLQNTHDWSRTQWGDLTVDGAYLAMLVWLALKTNRYWPMWAAAFQLLSVLIYLARMADRRVGALAPYAAVEIWSYLILIAIAVGSFGHWQTRRAEVRSAG
jgi:hypothetical protein